MADERTLARRYARALLSVASERGETGRVEADLFAVAEAWRASAELRNVVAHPAIDKERTRAAIAAVFEGKVSATTLRCLDLLIEKKRIGLIRLIAEEFDEAADEAQDIAKAEVRTFLPLDGGQRERLVAKLCAFTARAKVELDEAQDPALLGGIVVRIGDQVLDGSVAGALRKERERLILREEERARQAAAAAAEALGA